MSHDRLKTLRNYTPAEREKEDTMNEFFIQMAVIEQSRFEREEKRLEKDDSARKKEKQQIAEQRELDHQRMAEQHDYFARLLEEVRRPQEQTPPPLHTPRLTVQKFNEGSDDMAAYLDAFEATAVVSEWPRPHWLIHLRGSLSGAGLLAVSVSGGSTGRLPDRKTSTTVGLPNFYRNTQKEGVRPNVQP